MSGAPPETDRFELPGPAESGSRLSDALAQIDDGFAIIRRIDGLPADYLFIHCSGGFYGKIGFACVEGLTVRAMTKGWEEARIELYNEVLRTGVRKSYDRKIDSSGQCFEISVFRLDPAENGELGVHVRDVTEQRRAAHALEEINSTLEKRIETALADHRVLADLVENWQHEVFAIDPNFRQLACNRIAAAAFAAHYGKAPLIGGSLLDLTAHDALSRAASTAIWQRALAGESFVEIVNRPDSPCVLEISYSPLRDGAGDITGAYLVAADVTEREAARERAAALEAERRVLADIVEVAPMLVRAINTDFRLITSNKGSSDHYEQEFGQRPTLGDSILDAIGHLPDQLKDSLSIWRRALAGETLERAWSFNPGDTGIRHFEGIYGPMSEVAGKIIGAYQQYTDVTERVMQQQVVLAAETERRLWADLVDAWDAALLVVDRDFRWIAANRSASDNFLKFYGVRPKIGDSMLDQVSHLPHLREHVRQVWQRALDGEEFIDVHSAFSDDERLLHHFELRFHTLRNAAGEAIGAYQLVYDVTARVADQERLHEVEEALRQSQKMEAVGQLTGGLAHDFNNLLAAISGSLDLADARIGQGKPAEATRYLQAGKSSVRRAADLTHRLLTFSRRQTLSPKVMLVNRLLDDVAELVRRTTDPAITIETRAPPDLWPIMVDAHQLENALLNLCLNARDAMPDGGRIEIAAINSRLDAAENSADVVETGDYVAIRVSDGGSGIPDDIIGQVFEPFFTTKPAEEGTGLGLSMVYGFAHQSGGTVKLTSKINEGTSVTIFLPRHDGETAPGDAPLSAELDDGPQGGEVLVVDDEMLVRMMVADGLSDAGYVCAEAGDGPTALRHIESDARIDLLVSDVGLPGGMNGRQLADAARALRPGLKVLFITGYAEKAVLDDIGALTDTDVLLKPFDIDKLVAKVGAMVGHRQDA